MKENIEALLQYGEHATIECKEAKNKIPSSIWETYSSFANTQGGTILLGIKEEQNPACGKSSFIITGVEESEKIIKDFWNTINSDKVSSNILIDENVRECKCADKTVIRIDVPQARYKQKPVYVNGNPIKGTFKRNNEGDYHCTDEEVKAMLRDASDSGNDGGLLYGYTMEDIDKETFRSYRIEYELHNPDHVWNNLNDKDFLWNLGGYTVERETGKEGLTVAGLLMFGKGLAIRERFDNIRMDFIDETNLLQESRWGDRLTYDGMWENNLYNFFKRVMPKLVSNIRRPFKLEGITRVDDTEVHKAIREAFVNLIIHSDYLITGVLKVVKRDEGYLFSNPGSLKLPVQMIYQGGNSKARNPRIQTMFRMIGLGDNIGSGFPTILSAWGKENWRKPDLYDAVALHQVELKLWMVSLMPKECSEYLYKLMGNDYEVLEKEEQLILSTAYLEGDVTNSRMQTILNLHSTDVGKYLFHLVQENMLLVANRGRWTTYYINESYVIKPEQLQIQNMEMIHLNGSDQSIYDYIKENGFITSKQVVNITRINTVAGANVALNRLIDQGMIKKERKGRNIFYKLKS